MGGARGVDAADVAALFRGVALAALAGTSVAWLCIKHVLADDLWLFAFGFTVWLAVAFVIPLMLRRNSSIGQSPFLWISFLGMTLSYWCTVWPLDPFFRSPVWLGFGGVILCWAAATLVLTLWLAPRVVKGVTRHSSLA